MIAPKLVLHALPPPAGDGVTPIFKAWTVKGDAWPDLVTRTSFTVPASVPNGALVVKIGINAHGAGAAVGDPHPFKTWMTATGFTSTWDLDDLGAVLHDSTDGNEGMIGGPTYARRQASLLPNGEGYSTYLGSGDIGAIPPAANLDVTSDFTLMAWAQCGVGYWNPIALKDDGTDGYGITLQDSGFITGVVRLGGATSVINRAAGTPGVPGWIIFRNVAGTGSMWFNGAKIGADAVIGPAGTNGAYFALSADPGSGVYFVGYLQYEAVVNRGLSDAEIAAGWAAANEAPGTTPEIAALTSLTWNGDALTLVKSAGSVTPGTVPEEWAEEWVLVNPDAGTHDLVATHGAGTQVTGTRHTVMIAELYSGADQTSPVSASASAYGSGSIASVRLPSAPGELVTDLIATDPSYLPGWPSNGQQGTGIEVQGGYGPEGIIVGGSYRGGSADADTVMTWMPTNSLVDWLDIAMSLRGLDGPRPTIIPGAKIAGITLGGIGVPSRVVSHGTLEQIKEMLLKTTQLYTSEHTITLANDGNALVKLTNGMDWYGQILDLTVDGLSIWRGYIIAVQPDATNLTVNVTARSVMQKGAETSISASAALTGTAVNPADAILAILRKAFTDDQLDLAAIRLSGGAARAAGATIDYTFAAGSNVTAMSAVQSISALCGIAVYELDGLITARVWRPYDGNGSDLRFPITDANVREWGTLSYDTTMFNPGVDVSYTGGGSAAVDDRESARRNGLLDPATGKSLRRYAFSATDVIAHDLAGARYFGGLYLSMAGDRCAKLDVTVGQEFNGVALGDRFPVTQATRMDLTALPMEVYTIRQDLDRQQWTLALRQVFAA